MAKATGKVSGRADSTIVKMAYAEALGNMPLDQSKNYQAMVDMNKELMGDIEKQADILKASRAVDELAFKSAMSVFDDTLNMQAIDSDYDMMYSEVEAQRQAWENNKGFKGKDKELADWNRKNSQIIQSYQGNQQDLIDLKTGVDGKIYDIKGMSKSDLGFMTNIANYTSNRNRESGKYNARATEYMKNNPDATAEDMWNSLGVKDKGVVVKYHDPATGEYTYASKVLDENGVEIIASAKSGDLKNRFKLKADDSLTAVQKAITNVGANARKTSKNWNNFSTDYRNQLDNIIEDGFTENENTLNYLMKSKVGGQENSFDGALYAGKVRQTPEILAVLKNQVGYKKDDGDGFIDEDDFDTAENYQKVVRSILNGDLDKQSPGATKEMYLDFMDDELKRVHNLNKKAETVTGTTTDPATGTTPWKEWGAAYESQYVPTGGTEGQSPINVLWTTKRDRRRDLDNLETVRGSHYVYTWDGEKYNADGKTFSRYEVADIEGLIKEGEGRPTFNVKGAQQRKTNKELEAEGKASMNTLEQKGDDNVSGKLNEIFNMSMIEGSESELFFAPFSRDIFRGTYNPATSDAAGTNDVMIVDTRGATNSNSFKPLINKATGKPWRFKIGSKANENDLKIINKLMEDMDFIKKTTQLP